MASPVERPSSPTVISPALRPLRCKYCVACAALGPGTAAPPSTCSTVMRSALRSNGIANAVVRACSVLQFHAIRTLAPISCGGVCAAIRIGRPLSNRPDSIALSCKPIELASDRLMTMTSNTRPRLPTKSSPSGASSNQPYDSDAAGEDNDAEPQGEAFDVAIEPAREHKRGCKRRAHRLMGFRWDQNGLHACPRPLQQRDCAQREPAATLKDQTRISASRCLPAVSMTILPVLARRDNASAAPLMSQHGNSAARARTLRNAGATKERL